MITAINAKLVQLGNIETIQANLSKDSHELKVLEAKKEELITRQADIKASMELMCTDGKPTDVYTELIQKSKSVEASILEIPEEVRQFSEQEFRKYEKELIQLETKLEVMNTQLSEITDKEDKVRDSLETATIKLKGLFDQAILEDTQQRLDKANKALSFYVGSFERLGFHAYNDITEAEYTLAVNAIERFNSTLEMLGTQYSQPQIEKACGYISINPETTDYTKLIEALEEKLDQTKSSISEQIDLISRSEDYSKIPIDCNHMHDCPFITSIVKAKNSLLSNEQYVSLQKMKDELVSSIHEAKELLHEQDNMMNCIYQIRDLVKYMSSMSTLILKFPHTEKIRGIKHIVQCIVNLSRLDIDISAYREYTNYVALIVASKKDIKSLVDPTCLSRLYNLEPFLISFGIYNSADDVVLLKLYNFEVSEIKSPSLV